MIRVRARSDTVAQLLLCLGGPLVWAAHFFLLYGAATLACLNPAGHHSAPYFYFAIASTLLAILAVLGLMAWQLAGARQGMADHEEEGSRFLRVASLMLAGAGLFAIVWETLPVLALPACAGAAG